MIEYVKRVDALTEACERSSAMHPTKSTALILLLAALSACESRERRANELQPPVVAHDGVIHELVGTRWALVRLLGEPTTLREDAREPFIVLQSADASVVGYAGCNRIVGEYELSGEELHFRDIASTLMACPEMAIEDALLKALDATVRWSIAGDDLDLIGPDGAAVASFEARNL